MAQNYIILQLCLAGIMLIVTSVMGLLPCWMLHKMKQKGKDHNRSGWLSYLSCFSGGVFMATCFLDIMPHINENYEKITNEHKLSFRIPLSQLFICCGFFLVYLIEELTAVIFGNMGGGHGHSHGPPQPITTDMKKDNITRQSLLLDDIPSHLSPHSNGVVAAPSRTSLAVEDAAPWVVSDEKSNFLKSLTFSVAMSFHSLLEGFALGVQDTTTGIWALFFSLLLHKSIEAFSVGLQIARHNTNKMMQALCTTLIYAAMTPIGSTLGTLLQNSSFTSLYKDGAILFLESLAAGTFVYVTFLEILATEKTNNFNNFKQIFSIIVGFSIILTLQFIFGHDHEGGGGHSHDIPIIVNQP